VDSVQAWTGGRFVLPPELFGVIPRDVRLTRTGVAVVVVSVGLALSALVSVILMSIAHVRSEDARLLREREAVLARAQAVQVSVRRGEHPRRTVTYVYEVDGRSYSGRSVLRERERTIERGSIVPIAFVRSHPETNWRVGDEPRVFPIWPIPVVAAALLASALAVAWSVSRQRVLLSEGRVAEARITGQKVVRHDKGKAYRVSYEFRTLSGARHTGRYDTGRTPPPTGAILSIVYHRDNPQWSTGYPLRLVRPARAIHAGRRQR
jgi:hypothetical protein